ncbi:F-box/LRR-repeat protein At3g58900-like [Jatropha curcas]|uniref:F-box/LRR-repeat protein At3g58900-like n=1 Tax=Jatropha curcas TaxID=180498 RepID=UPI0005FB06D3|nr:F-box/LRR-repeat protein At3g58900-like [Jatropha curcas]
MASSSSSRKCPNTNPDRFNSLPDHIACHIISFLPTIDFLKLYITSKTCRELCLSAPSLTFDASPIVHMWRSNRDSPLSHIGNQLTKFLAQRGQRKIESFCIRWFLETQQFHSDLPISWLTYAVMSGVKDLKTVFIPTSKTNDFYLPHFLYHCESLRSLALGCTFFRVRWLFPSSIPFLNLEFLTLDSLCVEGRSFCEWISSWQRIRVIELFEVDGLEDIDIKSSVLERLVIVNPSSFKNLCISCERLQSLHFKATLPSFKAKGRSLKIISTPNLKYFTWVGNLVDHIVLKNLVHLELVQLSLVSNEHNFHILCNKLLSGITRTKELHLQGYFTKDLVRQDLISSPLFDTTKLCIKVHSLGHDFFPPAIISLLRRMKNLKTLWILSGLDSVAEFSPTPEEDSFDVGYWKRQCQDLSFVQELEKVEIEIFNGERELELAKYLLQYAKNLKEMVIFNSSPLASCIRKKINELACSSDIVVLKIN